MKKTCYGCRALDGDGIGGYSCNLKYKVLNAYNRKTGYISPQPEEDCPKPLTYEQLQEIMDKKEQG